MARKSQDELAREAEARQIEEDIQRTLNDLKSNKPAVPGTLSPRALTEKAAAEARARQEQKNQVRQKTKRRA